MRVLVDMDGVLADMDAGLERDWQALYGDEPLIPTEDRMGAHFAGGHPADRVRRLRSVAAAPGFFLSLPPIAGSVESVTAMREMGIDVFICSTPLSEYEHCVTEKYQWVEGHLGREWTRRLILTSDKTLVRGDVLIDDKPEVKGLDVPSWEHVVFDQPYNRHVTGKRRLDWMNWRFVLLGSDEN
ncbi:MAG: 5'-3'-deoxyribonucleotidase [Chloroflexi bacterium]|mgnify:CR=1 FL=1|nr:5'-3'-deoxyribonucleotidase [Chloroflexota bacterium]